MSLQFIVQKSFLTMLFQRQPKRTTLIRSPRVEYQLGDEFNVLPTTFFFQLVLYHTCFFLLSIVARPANVVHASTLIHVLI